jgi:Tol biopolymer transport system component
MADNRNSAMGYPTDNQESENHAEERLDSWKEIAAYLNRDVTTAQRWEKREGMPVHRHVHDRIGSVYAFRSELDAWTRSRKLEAPQTNDNGAALTATETAPPRRPAKVVSALKGWLGVSLAAAALLALGLALWLQSRDYFWRNPIAGARFQEVTNWEGAAQAAALSRDGQFVAFLSDRDGQMDVWITQVGSGQFHNLTHGSAGELVNPAIRPLGFLPDGSLVTFWVRKQNGAGKSSISIWAVPTLGGEPRPYLEGAAELDWSPDGSRVAYHTTAPGDPMFVADGSGRPAERPIFTMPAGMHCHFPLWAPDSTFIYFAEGVRPDKLNIWRIRPEGGTPEQVTSQAGGVTYPVLLDRRTLMYLARDADGSGPWLYSMDVEHRIAHRLTFGPDRYTSLAASGDGHRLAVTLASPTTTFWRMRITESPAKEVAPAPVSLTTATERAPRLGPGYLVYASSEGASEGIWKLANGNNAELWSGKGAQIIGAPAVSPDGVHIAFAALQRGQKLLYVMRSDGSNARIVADSLDVQGSPAWTPDGRWIAASANDNGVPHLYRIPAKGGSPALLVRDYALDPVWEAGGRFVIYSGRDIGTTFSVSAATADGAPYKLPNLTLTRGARHLALLRDGRSLVILRGEIQHKNLWLVDMETGKEQQLTNFPADFDVHDFDISPDGREVVLERVRRRSDVLLVDLPRR